MYLISESLLDKSPKITSVVAESFPHLRRGALRDFLNIMESQNIFKRDRWDKTNSTYTFETGSKIEFFSADQSSKVRGARRDRLFINEANNISFETFNQLEVRTNDFILLDWNPSEEYWFYTDVLGKRDDVEHIVLTYLDNEALNPSITRTIEQRRNNKNWWKVYALGELGEIESRVYIGWEIIEQVPKQAKMVRIGVDFGYTHDPTAIVAIYQLDGGFIVDEIEYKKGMINSDIAKVIKRDAPDILSIADSSEPKSIRELQLLGVIVIGATKGKGSISHGIDSVKSRKISVTKGSTNIIKEYRNYNYITDDDGKITNKPDDIMNHAMDAIRYAISNLIPDAESEDAYIQPEHELPGICKTATIAVQPVPTISTLPIGGTRKDRMKSLLENRHEKIESGENNYTTPEWEYPGIKK